MKKLIIWVFLLACLAVTSVNAQVFLIERGASSFTYPNIKAAVDALQDGDKLYLPPGIFSLEAYSWTGYNANESYPNTLAVGKKVAIYGAGYNQGASSTILRNGSFRFIQGATGSSVTGVRFDGPIYLDKASNVNMSRCLFTSYVYFTDFSTNDYVNECEFLQSINMSSQSSTVFTKCIFNTNYGNGFHNSTLSNNLFMYQYGFVFTNCSMINNIIVGNRNDTNTALTVSGTNNSFSYNLWIGTIMQYNPLNNNTFSNEITEVPFSATFEDFNSGNYHLKAASAGKNAANDGRDVGIYGTAFPFKESRLPSIPYFSVKAISPETDASGNLPVNLKIEAQER